MKQQVRITHQQKLTQHQRLSPQMIQMLGTFQLSYADFQDTLLEKCEGNVFLTSTVPPIKTTSTIPLDTPIATPPHSLKTCLLSQLDIEALSQKDHAIGHDLIDAINDDGYLLHYSDIVNDITSHHRVSPRKIHSILKIIQGFEPDGVGARSLKECLLIQLNEKNIAHDRLYALLKTIITKHLDIMNDPEKIEKKLTLNTDQITRLRAYLNQNFNPKPGLAYRSETHNPTLTPSFDITVDDHTLKLTNLEKTAGTQLRLSSRYTKLLKDPSTSADTRQFLEQHYQKATAYLEEIQQRWARLSQLMRYISQYQTSFFIHGPAYLKPLLQKTISKDLGIAPSTVSRLVSAKSIQTPHGIFLLKRLCPRNHFGKTTVQFQRLVHDYFTRYPNYSDEKIRHCLQKDLNITLARRTVTKYRLLNGIGCINHR